MFTVFSKDHPIIEKGMMEFQPFGQGPDGRTIRDLSGIVVKADLDLLDKLVTAKKGPQHGQQAIEELVRLLNERIPDRAYRVSRQFLENPWNSYSNEFSAFAGEFCIAISGEPGFFFELGRHPAISPIIQVLGRPFSVPQIYKMSAYFSQRYAKDSFLVEAVTVADGSAILGMTFNERMKQQFGPYLRRCANLWCDAVKGYFVGVPERFHNLPPATVKDRLCMVEGDDRCEWEVTWSSAEQRGTLHQSISGLAKRVLRQEIEQKERVMAEQVQILDARHVELQETYFQQQQLTAELQRRVDHLTALHESGLVFASILHREALIEMVLETVTQKLHYDRGIICLFDKERQLSYVERFRGGAEEIADFAHSLEIPVTDPESLEGRVLLLGEAVLIKDVHKEWDSLHPLNQELMRKMEVTSIISLPLKVKGQVLGSLTVNRTRGEMLTQEDLDLMGTLASQIAVALDNTQAYQQIGELIAGLEAKVHERTSELADANEKLRELDRLKSDFFANISHELRTPLTLSLGSFKTLLRSPLANDYKDVIGSGMRNTTRLLYLINELLELARFDSGRVALKKRPLDLKALIKDIAASFESSFKRRIHLLGGQEPIVMNADSNQMKKVIYNLLSNALKFSDPEEGQVWIRLKKANDLITIAVEDNGIGIPGDQLDRIFERFIQVEASTTRKYEGTGIGLALVREIVKLHGGDISVESELGQGSTFTITMPTGNVEQEKVVSGDGEEELTLPLSREVSSPENPLPIETMEGENSKPCLLVVEDNADMRCYLERLLSNQYRVLLAKDGVEGLKKAKVANPDLILTDGSMPHMSGYELLNAIRQDRKLQSTPVIVLTARAGTEARIESFNAGADDYVSKPFDENELVARINNILRLRRQERELAELREEKLKRFLPSQLADLISTGKGEEILKSHRAEITVVFLDLRGFTTFAERADPEHVATVLHEYQTEMGKYVSVYGGTLERFTGDGMMIFFNDPIPLPDHAGQAVRMAVAMRQKISELRNEWDNRGFHLGSGIGIATGYATIGMIGYEGRRDYSAIGTVTNLAARLCQEALHGQILVSAGVKHFIEPITELDDLGTLPLKGFTHPIAAYNIRGLKQE